MIARPSSQWHVTIPLFELKREIGSGANGTVYEATDTLLDRVVAVKVWNGRGRSKAKSETTKIAGLTHPLIVATHMFGLVDEHPYAVMEFVPGVSGKEWMKSAPSFQSRVEIWRMYSRALRFMHNKKIVHGDPHLGNIIVFIEDSEELTSRNWDGEPSIAMKLADTGTSEFWANHNDFAAREVRLIRETAARIFQAERFDALVDNLDVLNYAEMLRVCDAVVEYISTLHGVPDEYRRSQVADELVKLLISTPVFNLDEVYQQTFNSPITQVHRVVARLNGALTGLDKKDWWTGAREITEVTRSRYYQLRNQWRSSRT